MSQSLQHLVSSIGTQIAKNIVQTQILYPRTDEQLLDNEVLELDLDSTLVEVIQEIQDNIELRAIDAVKDSIVLSKMMEEFK